MWELDCEESWALKNWRFWTVVEKTLESPLDCKEIQPVLSEGDQPWDFFGRNDAKAETPVFWPPHVKSWLIGKVSEAGRDWGQEEKGTTEDEMAGWHHGLDGRESEWPPGVGDGQGGLACCNSWGREQSDTTEQLNWTELNWIMNECWILSKGFSVSIEISTWFLSFNLLIGCITLIDLCILKNPCIPGITPTWSRCMSFLMCCWILFARTLLRIFTSMLISDIGLQFCILCCLCLVLVSGWWWPRRRSLEMFFPLQLFESVLEG